MSFRPLAGFWFLNFGDGNLDAAPVRNCFRPLAGFWFLNFFALFCLLRSSAVSVPLRGSGS